MAPAGTAWCICSTQPLINPLKKGLSSRGRAEWQLQECADTFGFYLAPPRCFPLCSHPQHQKRQTEKFILSTLNRYIKMEKEGTDYPIFETGVGLSFMWHLQSSELLSSSPSSQKHDKGMRSGNINDTFQKRKPKFKQCSTVNDNYRINQVLNTQQVTFVITSVTKGWKYLVKPSNPW